MRDKGKRLRPERGATPPSESERGWGPASRKRSGQGKRQNQRASINLAASMIVCSATGAAVPRSIGK